MDTSLVLDSMLMAAPMLLLSAMGIVLMVLAAVMKPFSPTVGWGTTLATLAAALVLVALQAGEPAAEAFAGMLRVDLYGHFFAVVMLLAAIFALLIAADYMERIGVRVGEFYALLLFGVSGMLGMAYANDLMMVFIALEVMSIAMYVLCAIKRADDRAVEAGFKYFILGAFSSAIMLYGVSFLYGVTETTSLSQLASWLATHPETNSVLAVGGVMVIVGFGFKVASVPFHMWTPDVYQGAPTAVTSLMASGVKAASFAAFGRFVIGALGNDAATWEMALWIMAALTMLVGNVAALVQDDLKRILAYSSIAHAGYLLMALSSVGGMGADQNPALGSLGFYLLAYTFMNAGAFAVLSLMTKDGNDNTGIEALAGLGKSHPWLAAGLSLCLVSLAGIPPTMGFVGKFYLFSSAVGAGQVGLAMVGAIGAAAGVYYYLRPMIYMYMREGHPEVATDGRARIALAVSCVAILVLGLMPGAVLAAADASVRAVLG
ncbi:MAG: NADH-quinone oxidoreductase subunit N [Deltaproteobacteria bacterium]|nr:NADH-quinone oxidoreductase subunit N [Deltaproteobacteria bacterium]